MNIFEMTIVVGVPAFAVTSMLFSAALRSQVSGYLLIAASTFAAWVFSIVVMYFVFAQYLAPSDAIPGTIGAAKVAFFMGILVFLVRSLVFYFKSRRANG